MDYFLTGYLYYLESVLGPLSFLLYIDDFHQSISHSTVLMFADDIAIYKEIESQLDHKLQANLNVF